jgi:hypothetical protein
MPGTSQGDQNYVPFRESGAQGGRSYLDLLTSRLAGKTVAWRRPRGIFGQTLRAFFAEKITDRVDKTTINAMVKDEFEQRPETIFCQASRVSVVWDTY